MWIEDNDVPEVKNLLENSWKEGKKFLVYPMEGSTKASDIHTFKFSNAANQFCDEAIDNQQYYKFRPINSALRNIYQFENKLAVLRTDVDKVQAVLPKYPIEANSSLDNLPKLLAAGSIQPVIYKRTIVPSEEINNYTLLHHVLPKGMVYENGHKVTEVASFKTFDEAVKGFMKEHQEQSLLPTAERNNLVLLGQFRGAKLNIGYDGLPGDNTGVSLFIAYNNVDYDTRKETFDYKQLVRPGDSVELRQPVYAQYNQQTNKVNFWDKNLTPINPETTFHHMKVDFYGKEAIDISPRFVQNVNQTEKIQNRQKID